MNDENQRLNGKCLHSYIWMASIIYHVLTIVVVIAVGSRRSLLTPLRVKIFVIESILKFMFDLPINNKFAVHGIPASYIIVVLEKRHEPKQKYSE